MEPVAKRPKTGKQQDAASATVPTICVLGATGVGKGSTLNSCFRSKQFGTSSMFSSDTIQPISFELPWRGTGDMMRGVDLCGFSDSEGRDTGFIESMVAYLRSEVCHVNVFLLLLNSQEPRIGMHLKDMLAALKSVFGVSFMKHVLVGFTRWDYSERGAILRRGVTKDSLSCSVNAVLRDLVGHTHDCECIFLDNTVHMLAEDELRELHTCKHCGACGDELAQVTRAFDDALDAVRRAAVGNEPFLCAHIESTLAERDVGRDAIEREAAAVEQGREALDALTGGWEALAIEEPESLEGRLEEEVRLARDALHHFLAAKCKPDLEHVMSSVMETFDARVADETKRAVFRNRTAAASHNRSLRMELIQEYKECIAEQVALGDDAIGQDASSTPHPTPRQRFDAVYVKFAELVVRFATRSKGGTLAWQPLVVLQDQLRMEQVDTREKILRTELKSGAALPDISAPIKEASALVKVFGDQPVPTWVLKMLSGDQERSGPGGGGSRSCAAGHAIRPATG
jgi:hypothetical protein